MVNSLHAVDKVLYMRTCFYAVTKRNHKIWILMALGLMHYTKTPFKESKRKVTHHSLMQMNANQTSVKLHPLLTHLTISLGKDL